MLRKPFKCFDVKYGSRQREEWVLCGNGFSYK